METASVNHNHQATTILHSALTEQNLSVCLCTQRRSGVPRTANMYTRTKPPRPVPFLPSFLVVPLKPLTMYNLCMPASQVLSRNDLCASNESHLSAANGDLMCTLRVCMLSVNHAPRPLLSVVPPFASFPRPLPFFGGEVVVVLVPLEPITIGPVCGRSFSSRGAGYIGRE